MAVTIGKNYVPGTFEAFTDEDIGQFMLNEWSYFKLDGFYKHYVADPTIKQGGVIVPTSAYELKTDTTVTTQESQPGLSGKTVYALIRIINATYAGVDLTASGNDFGTMVDNEANVAYSENYTDTEVAGVTPQYTVETASDDKTITTTATNYLLIFTRQATAKVVTLDDATACTGCIRRIRVTGAGVGNVSLATVSSQTIGGFTATDWDWDGTGQLSLISDGSNWQVLEEGIWDTYNVTYDSISYPQDKYTNGKIVRRGFLNDTSLTQAEAWAFFNPIVPNNGEVASVIGLVTQRHGKISRTSSTIITYTYLRTDTAAASSTYTIHSDGATGDIPTSGALCTWETKNTIWYTP